MAGAFGIEPASLAPLWSVAPDIDQIDVAGTVARL